MRVSADGHAYEWVESWAQLPDSETERTAWTHNGLAVTRDGHIVAITSGDSRVLVLDREGRIGRAFDCGLVEGHGLAIGVEGEAEYLWIADCGFQLTPQHGYEPWPPQPTGRVLKVDLATGTVLAQLRTPEHEAYEGGSAYLPTAVAPAPDGSVWVADGYGASLLHHFAGDGSLLATVSGEESDAGRLNQPHGILIDQRKPEPELYVTDRLNERLLVFDLDGRFRREVGKDLLAMPSVLATSGDLLVVGGLQARVALLDLEDRLVGYLGDNQPAVEKPGWPNGLADGEPVRPRTLEPGKFVSPHGIAVDHTGTIYVNEFLIGGRHVKLEPVPRTTRPAGA